MKREGVQQLFGHPLFVSLNHYQYHSQIGIDATR